MVHLRRDEQRVRLRARQPARRVHESVQLHRVDRRRDRRALAAGECVRQRGGRRLLRRPGGGGEPARNPARRLQGLPLPAGRVPAARQRVQRLPRVLRRQRRVALQARAPQLHHARPRLTITLTLTYLLASM